MNGNFNATPIKKDENVVTTDTTQTITGQKQFTGGLYVGGGLIFDNDDKEVLGKGDLVVKDSSVDVTHPLGSSGPAKLIGHAENEGTIELSVEGQTNNQSDGKTTLIVQYDRVTINNKKVATEDQVNAKQDTIDFLHKLSADLVDDTSTTNKFVTSTEKSTWSSKQDAIDSSHKLSADLVDDTSTTNKFTNTTEKSTWNGKQDALVSGTNIKTINNQSILGSGDLSIQGGVTDVQMNGQSIVSDTVAEIPTESATTIPIDSTPTQNSPNLVTSGGVYAYCQEVSYLTTAPDSDNTSGRLKIVVLASEPATRYNGYIYFITEA